tara:strand:- start:18 stop:443 length:426 start_codon:yes stop_codon:yes gene_type:complete
MEKFIQKLNYVAFLIAGVFVGLAIQLGERKLSEPKPVIYSLDLILVDEETEDVIEHPIVTLPQISGHSASEVETGGKLRMIWQADKKWDPLVRISADGYEEKIVPLNMIQVIDSNYARPVIFGPYTLKLRKSNKAGDDNSE